ESPTAAGPGRRLARNWLLASCIVLLLLLIVLAAPFYNGGMLVGKFLSARRFLQWRYAGGDVSAHRRDFPVIAIRFADAVAPGRRRLRARMLRGPWVSWFFRGRAGLLSPLFRLRPSA